MSRTTDLEKPRDRRDESGRDRHRRRDDSGDRHHHRRTELECKNDDRQEERREAETERRDDRDSRHQSRGHSGSGSERRSRRSHRSKRSRDHDSPDSSGSDRHERKHKKHHKDKKHRHRLHSDRQPATSDLEQRIQQTKHQLAHLSSASPTPALLTADDYYARSAEFRLWLHNSRALHLDELAGERARELFGEFCGEWNEGRLPAVFYKGVDSSALSGSVLTGHKWGFLGRLTEEDKLANASVRDSVDTATHHHTYQQEFISTAAASPNVTASALPSSASPSTTRPASSVVSMPPPPKPFGALSKVEKRQHVRHAEDVMDEVAPRETGREAMLLKRREKGEYSRRERGGDGLEEMDDDALMGGGGNGGLGGGSELARLKERDFQRREMQNKNQAAKREEWERKEKDRMRAMLQSIGQADKYNI